MLELLRSLVFPRECIGCGREEVLLCAGCRERARSHRVARLAGLEVISCVPYAGVVREAIGELKRGRRALAADLAALASPYAQPGMVLVPIPTTRRRRAERGFDQTRLLARALRRTCGVGIAELLARRSQAAQQGRSRAERLAATGRFRVRRGVSASAGDLVLFDDVRTTGSTLVDATQTLEAAGFVIAGALTIAWTPEERE